MAVIKVSARIAGAKKYLYMGKTAQQEDSGIYVVTKRAATRHFR